MAPWLMGRMDLGPAQDLSVRQVAGAHQAPEGVADDPGGDQRGDLGVVVGRRALDDLDAGQRAGVGDDLDELQDLARQEPARLGPAGAGHEGGVEAVDVEGQPDRVGAVPGHLERPLGGRLDAHLDAVGDGHDRRAALPADLHARPGRLPAADADLDQVLRRHVREVRGVEPRRGVHPLVEVGLLGVDVAVEVDDPEVAAARCGGDAARGRVADRVVAAEHDREGAARRRRGRPPC